MAKRTYPCGKQAICRGFCSACYQRWYREQVAVGVIVPVRGRQTPEARFFAKVDKNGPVPAHYPELGPCWIWTAATTPAGYGQIVWNRKLWIASRFAYAYFIALFPEHLDVRHKCDNPPCVNPDHLILGTRLENMLDMKERGRAQRKDWLVCDHGHDLTLPGAIQYVAGKKRCGECHREDGRRRDALKRGGPPRQPKVSAEQAADIRAKRAAGVPLKALAAEYGVDKSYLCAIAKGRRTPKAT